MALYEVSTGNYSKQIVADSHEMAGLIAFALDPPDSASFAVAVKKYDEDKQKFTDARYRYSVYCYKDVGIIAVEQRKNKVVPRYREKKRLTAASITGACVTARNPIQT